KHGQKFLHVPRSPWLGGDRYPVLNPGGILFIFCYLFGDTPAGNGKGGRVRPCGAAISLARESSLRLRKCVLAKGGSPRLRCFVLRAVTRACSPAGLQKQKMALARAGRIRPITIAEHPLGEVQAARDDLRGSPRGARAGAGLMRAVSQGPV